MDVSDFSDLAFSGGGISVWLDGSESGVSISFSFLSECLGEMCCLRGWEFMGLWFGFSPFLLLFSFSKKKKTNGSHSRVCFVLHTHSVTYTHLIC